MSDPFDEVVTELAHAKEPLCVTAAAGCGKTEAIARAVKQAEGKQLILTHTNAGVAALRSRLRRYSVPESKYCVETIASWLLKYVHAYPSMSGFTNPRPVGEEWKGVYPAAQELFPRSFVRDVLRASYAGAFVDEYQDCTKQQHSIVFGMCEYLPVRVLGDPLQSIFGFQADDPLVNWGTDVKENFKSLPELLTPYRWEKTDGHPNANPLLGQQLTKVRLKLLAEELVNLNDYSEIRWLPWSEQQEKDICWKALTSTGTVVGIHKWPGDAHHSARKMEGRYQSIEEMDCSTLMDKVRLIDVYLKQGNYQAVASQTMSLILKGCGNQCLFIDKGYLQDKFAKLRRGDLLVIADIVEMILHNPDARVYRCELLTETKRAVQEFASGQYDSFGEAAYIARSKTRVNGRRPESRIISRTLLIKGLEFDHAIVLKADELKDRENFYVAITRGSQSLVVLSPSPKIQFS